MHLEIAASIIWPATVSVDPGSYSRGTHEWCTQPKAEGLRSWLPDSASSPDGWANCRRGLGGGNPADAGYSILASLGYAVVTVAYFGMPRLPSALSEIPQESPWRARTSCARTAWPAESA